MALYTYNCKDWLIQLGPYTLDGFGENDAFSISYDNENYTVKNGIDGAVTRSKHNAAWMATITFNLMQNSKGNADLYKAAMADMIAPELQTAVSAIPIIGPIIAAVATKTLPVAISNPKLGRTYTGQVWLQKWPDDAAAQDIGETEWVFQSDELIPIMNPVP